MFLPYSVFILQLFINLVLLIIHLLEILLSDLYEYFIKFATIDAIKMKMKHVLLFCLENLHLSQRRWPSMCMCVLIFSCDIAGAWCWYTKVLIFISMQQDILWMVTCSYLQFNLLLHGGEQRKASHFRF